MKINPSLTKSALNRRNQGFTLIEMIGVLAVKCKEKTYVGIHRLSTRYWQDLCGHEVTLPPISESQLRERLKKICFEPGTGAGYIYQIFSPDHLR